MATDQATALEVLMTLLHDRCDELTAAVQMLQRSQVRQDDGTTRLKHAEDVAALAEHDAGWWKRVCVWGIGTMVLMGGLGSVVLMVWRWRVCGH